MPLEITEVLHQQLFYRGPEDTMEYAFDEDQRLLSFFGVDDGGKIYVRELN